MPQTQVGGGSFNEVATSHDTEARRDHTAECTDRLETNVTSERQHQRLSFPTKLIVI